MRRGGQAPTSKDIGRMCPLEGVLGVLGVLFAVCFGVFYITLRTYKRAARLCHRALPGGDSGIPEEGTGSRCCQRVPSRLKSSARVSPAFRSVPPARASGTYFSSLRAVPPELGQCPCPGQRALPGAERPRLRGSDAQVVIVTPRVSRSRVMRVFQLLCK